MLRSSFSLALILISGLTLAQNRQGGQPVQVEVLEEEDTVEVRRVRKDTVKEKISFRSIRFGTDLLALVLSGFDQYNGWEVNADADFGRFYLSADYGFAARDEVLASGGEYQGDGNYWRAGFDLNLLKKDPDRNMLFFGLRYARSSFSEKVLMTGTDPFFGDLQYQLANPAASAAWAEMVAGLRVKIWKEFWMGFTSRLKLALSISGTTDLAAYYVPGYGVAGQGATWGFNYQIFWRIPVGRNRQPKVQVP